LVPPIKEEEQMTWKQFKEQVEAAGVKDDDAVDLEVPSCDWGSSYFDGITVQRYTIRDLWEIRAKVWTKEYTSIHDSGR
jgi:hypothetical protein